MQDGIALAVFADEPYQKPVNADAEVMLKVSILLTLLILPCAMSQAAPFNKEIPMRMTAASTFYVDGYLNGYGDIDLMVDTGSSYTTINEQTLAVLQENGGASYVKQLTGIMADGSTKTVPVYRIAGLSIGDGCYLKNVEAAVFPGSTRYILGISALRKAAPFVFSMEPPALKLSNCVPIPAAPVGADGLAGRAPVAQAELAQDAASNL
jgi:hypothetical protein